MVILHCLLNRLSSTVARYRSEVASPREHLSLLRWQIDQRHSLGDRTTLPGHLTTSAIVVSPDHAQVLLINHIAIGRWLQPGGHYEPAPLFQHSAAREAIEETGVQDLALHPWHGNDDLPFAIDSHDVPGKAARAEPDHIHHDLQYLFLADPGLPLSVQIEEVHAAVWKPVHQLREIAPRALDRLASLRLA
jgi:8-oxo-dGTP pyrophosphatase MutT (NUDIX family)